MKINSKEINKINTNILNIFKDKKNKNFSIKMAKKDKVDFIYNTTALEGNTMTYPEVETILDGITVGGKKINEEQQILNQNRAINLLFKMVEKENFNLSKNTFLSLHKHVAFEEALLWGEFRQGNVNIGGTEYKPPSFDKLDNIYKNGIKEINKIKNVIVKAITFFLFGAKNQFFYDGNKRTSRLMMNGILMANGLPILNIKAKDKLAFNTQMIKFYNGENIKESIIFLSNYYLEENKHLITNYNKSTIIF